MIWLIVVPGGNGCLYPKSGAEGKDVILEFDPKRLESLREEIFHIVLGHHLEIGNGKGLSRKRKWEMEKEVTCVKLKIGLINTEEAINCLYNVRQDIILGADEGRQIDVEDRRWLSHPSFLSQVEEITGASKNYIQDYLVKEFNG